MRSVSHWLYQVYSKCKQVFMFLFNGAYALNHLRMEVNAKEHELCVLALFSNSFQVISNRF